MTKDLQASNCTMLDFMCLLLQGMHTSAMNLLSLKKRHHFRDLFRNKSLATKKPTPNFDFVKEKKH